MRAACGTANDGRRFWRGRKRRPDALVSGLAPVASWCAETTRRRFRGCAGNGVHALDRLCSHVTLRASHFAQALRLLAGDAAGARDSGASSARDSEASSPTARLAWDRAPLAGP